MLHRHLRRGIPDEEDVRVLKHVRDGPTGRRGDALLDVHAAAKLAVRAALVVPQVRLAPGLERGELVLHERVEPRGAERRGDPVRRPRSEGVAPTPSERGDARHRDDARKAHEADRLTPCASGRALRARPGGHEQRRLVLAHRSSGGVERLSRTRSKSDAFAKSV